MGHYCRVCGRTRANEKFSGKMIKRDYLEIEYSGKLPMIVFSEKGWEIERETYAEELLYKLTALLDGKDYSFLSCGLKNIVFKKD